MNECICLYVFIICHQTLYATCHINIQNVFSYCFYVYILPYIYVFTTVADVALMSDILHYLFVLIYFGHLSSSVQAIHITSNDDEVYANKTHAHVISGLLQRKFDTTLSSASPPSSIHHRLRTSTLARIHQPIAYI